MRYWLAFLLMALLVAGCAGEEDLAWGLAAGGEGQTRLTVDVVETPWLSATTDVSAVRGVTRAGETLNGLRATSGTLPDGYGHGFGLYSADMSLENRQVTWDNAGVRWDYRDDIYWPNTTTGADFSVYAYAPYKSTPWTVTNGVLTFTTDAYGLADVDLLYAADTDVKRSDGLTNLTFNHALAKVSLGTVANTSSARDMLISDISFSGNFYVSGNLSLNAGTWSGETQDSPALKTKSALPDGEYLFVPSGAQNAVRTTKVDIINAVAVPTIYNAVSPMLIPGQDVTVTYTYYEQPDVVPLSDDMFYHWDGRNGEAQPTTGTMLEYKNQMGTLITKGSGETVMGSAHVYYLDYADLTDYDKLVIVGTPNMGFRILMNRLASGESTEKTYYNGSVTGPDGGQLIEVWANIGVDGYVVADLTEWRKKDGFVHLNALKAHTDSDPGTVTKLMLLKKANSAKTISHKLTPEQGVNKTLNLSVGQNFEVVIDGAGGASRLMNN